MSFKREIEKIIGGRKNSDVYDYELEQIVEKCLKSVEEIPHLFRYSPTDYYNIRNLELEQVVLTPSGHLNDVFEGLSCEINDKVLDSIDQMSEIAYIKSFSERNNNLLMWAHYANDYTGMCVEYDFNRLDINTRYHLFPVTYSEKRICNVGLDRTIEEFSDLKRMNTDRCFPNETDFLTDIMSLFLIKSSEWEHEEEWRIIATYPQLFNTASEIEYSEESKMYGLNSRKILLNECIENVYLGPKVRKEILEHILEICDRKNNAVGVYSSKLSKGEYKIEFIREN